MKNYLFLSVVLTAMLSSCIVENVKIQPVYVDSVYIKDKISDIIVGDETTFGAAYTPYDADEPPVFTWQSSDSKIATIDQNGLMKAVGEGNVTITLKAVAPQKKGSIELSDAIEIIVHPVVITGIQLNNKKLEVFKGAPSVALTYQIIPVDAKPKAVEWSSSNSNVATVNTNGVVTFVGVGTAVITVRVSGTTIKDECNVTVNPTAVTNMYFESNTYKVEQGFSAATKLIFLPEDADNKSVTYKSSNTAIATVSANGVVSGVSSEADQGKGPGKATITATAVVGGRTATCTVEVYSVVDLVTVTVVIDGINGTIVPTLHNNSSKPVTMVHFRLMEGPNSQNIKTSILLNDAILPAYSQYTLNQSVSFAGALNPRARFLIEYNGQQYIRDIAITYP